MLKNFLSAENKKRKSYVLDTSVLVYHGEAIHNFPDSNIYIPLEVLEELDNLKTRMDKVGANGRYVNKYLDKLRNKGSLIDGVEIENNMIIYIAAFSDITLLPLSMSDTVDNKIISCGLVLAKEDHDVTVVSRDISLRVRCDSLDIDAIDYDKELHLKRDFFNDGIITIKTTTDVIDQFYETGVVDLDDYEQYELLPNQGVMLKCGQSSALGLAVDDRTVKRLNYASDKGFEMEGIAPRSAEQSIAAELLMDPDIHLVTMTGMAGSGKTLLSIAAALKQIQTKRYKKIMLARPAESTSAALGFMPGPQPLDARLATPDGWINMGDIKINDYVIDETGKPTKVLGIFPKGKKMVYKVSTTDGTSTECCEDHLWYTQTKENFKRNKPGSVKSTLEIMNTIMNNKNKPNHYLPRNGAVQYNKQELSIPPYTMGALLGDGSMYSENSYVTMTNVDYEILERVKSELNSIGSDINIDKKTKYISYNIFNTEKLFNNKTARRLLSIDLETKEEKIYNSIGIACKELKFHRNLFSYRNENIINDKYFLKFIEPEVRWTSIIKEKLNNLNLLGKNYLTKFIPKQYMYSSIDDRIQLLRGLMDTDGTIKEGGCASFTTVSKQLADDIIELVQSLGGRAIVKSRNRIGKVSKISNENSEQIITSRHISYEFTISMPQDINPFYLKRKAERHLCRYIHAPKIISIEPVGEKEVQCIKVDNARHLYLTDNFIVTHNTKDEKLEPWLQPFFDNLEVILGANIKNNSYFQKLMEKGIIEMEAISFIRGRTLPNTIFIIDEAQNISHHEAKALLTRMGENSKIVLIGDLEQIDSKHLDEKTSGLASVVDLFKEFEHAGHIRLRKGERSKLATYAAKVM